jgi:hypothetical protein
MSTQKDSTMLRHQVHFLHGCSSQVRILAAVFLTTLSLGSFSLAVELPPDFTGLFYPGIPEGVLEAIASRAASQLAAAA